MLMPKQVKLFRRRNGPNVLQNLPNTACTGQVGVCAIYKQFSGFEFILLPGRVQSRPPASNASRWAADAVIINHRHSRPQLIVPAGLNNE
jgi:hypothetical protein